MPLACFWTSTSEIAVDGSMIFPLSCSLKSLTFQKSALYVRRRNFPFATATIEETCKKYRKILSNI